MTKPLIGISGKQVFGRDVAGNIPSLYEAPAHVYWANYSQGILAAGGIPIYLPLNMDPVDAVERCDGLLLTGGTDISPDLYGQESTTDAFAKEPLRDSLELALMDAAVPAALPVLGICRGHQIINVHAGGSLNQDVPEHGAFDLPITTERHEVTFAEGSVLGSIYPTHHKVNSLHHQTVARLGDGVVATAFDEEGSVEGLELPGLPIVSVQWHPEMMTTRDTDPVFEWLINQSS